MKKTVTKKKTSTKRKAEEVNMNGYEKSTYTRRANDDVEPTRVHWMFYVVVAFGVVYLVLH